MVARLRFRTHRSLSPPPSPYREDDDVDDGTADHEEEPQSHKRMKHRVLGDAEGSVDA